MEQEFPIEKNTLKSIEKNILNELGSIQFDGLDKNNRNILASKTRLAPMH